MTSSSGTVGESEKDVLVFFGDLFDVLDDDLPPKKGDEPILLLIGLELTLDSDILAKAGDIGLLGTALMLILLRWVDRLRSNISVEFVVILELLRRFLSLSAALT